MNNNVNPAIIGESESGVPIKLVIGSDHAGFPLKGPLLELLQFMEVQCERCWIIYS